MPAHEYPWDQEQVDLWTIENRQPLLDAIEAGYADVMLTDLIWALRERWELVKVQGVRTESTEYDDNGNILLVAPPVVGNSFPSPRPPLTRPMSQPATASASTPAGQDDPVCGTYYKDGNYYRVAMTRQTKQPVVKRMFVARPAVIDPRSGAIIEAAKIRWIYLGKNGYDVNTRTYDISIQDCRDHPEWKLTLDQAKKAGMQFGICVRCGRTLTDMRSVEQGIGPVCIQMIQQGA